VPLLISVPARELQPLRVRNSIFPVDLLLAAPISEPLRNAALVVRQSALAAGTEMSVLVRPEIYTHGELLDWLRARAGDVSVHIHLSDGSTIKIVPGLSNHLFFYGGAAGRSLQALMELVERAPELGSALDSQINSAFRLCPGTAADRSPPSSILSPHSEIDDGEDAPLLYSSYFNRHSVEDSLNRVMEWGAIPKPVWEGQIRYFVATEAALLDRPLVSSLARAVETAFYGSGQRVLIALPSAGDQTGFRERAGHLISQLIATEIILPRVRSESVLLCDAEVPAEWFVDQTAQLVAHDSFPFWNHTQDYYRQFTSLELFATDGLTEVDRSIEVVHALTGFAATGREHIRSTAR
jgi:hypothetical protein